MCCILFVAYHSEDTCLTHTTMMGAIGFNTLALVTISNIATVGAREQGQVLGFLLEHELGLEFALRQLHLIDVGLEQKELNTNKREYSKQTLFFR